MMTQKEVQRLFTYNLETGIFIRNIATGRGNRFPIGSIVGTRHSQGYLVVNLNSQVYRLHRLAWLYVYGYLPKELDHINGIKDDNSIINLRECSRSENVCNYKNKSNNTTGVKGVYFSETEKKYKAQVRLADKSLYKGFPLKNYDSKEEALTAAESWINKVRPNLHGEFTNHG